MATPRNNVVSRLRELNFIFLSNGTRSHGQWGYIKQCKSQVNVSIDWNIKVAIKKKKRDERKYRTLFRTLGMAVREKWQLFI